MEQEKTFLEKRTTAHEARLRVRGSLDSRGMPGTGRQGQPSSGKPPASIADAEDVVGVAAEIPKIVHQVLAMTQFFSAWGL
jgi:hypothetical protein